MHDDKIIKYLPRIKNYNPILEGTNIGAITDVETTGTEDFDEIIQFSAIPFKFTDDLIITEVLPAVTYFNEPRKPISEETTAFTGITNDMVKGHRLDNEKINKLLSDNEVLISHNAYFDRFYIEKQCKIPDVLWACSMKDINWKAKGINSAVQEYIAFKYGFWYEAHQSEEDCLALIHILAQENNFEELMTRAYQKSWKIILADTKFEEKEIIKKKHFYWNGSDKTWRKDGVTDLTEMKEWLASNLSYYLVKKEEETMLTRYKRT